MKPIAIHNVEYSKLLYIDFVIGTTCNFHCHYCFDGCNDNKYRFPNDIELIKKNLGYLISTYKKDFNKTSVRLHITGGEPTLWPDIGFFAKYFHEEFQCKVSISTNGSRTLRWWQENAKYFSDIAISIHNEEADINHLTEILDWMFYNIDSAIVHGTVLMDPKHWDKCMTIANTMSAHPTPWLLKVKPVVIDGNTNHYTEEQYEYLSKQVIKHPPSWWVEKFKDIINFEPNEKTIKIEMEDHSIIDYDLNTIFKNNWNDFRGWNCNLGVDRFSIERDGSIQGTCGQTDLFGLDSPLNIYDIDLEKKFSKDNIKPTICSQYRCSCPSDVWLEKCIN